MIKTFKLRVNGSGHSVTADEDTPLLDFGQKLMGVKSPSEFIELWAEHTRKHFETLTEQAKEVLAIGRKLTLTATEPHGMS